jgi:hypothetical protein
VPRFKRVKTYTMPDKKSVVDELSKIAAKQRELQMTEVYPFEKL